MLQLPDSRDAAAVGQPGDFVVKLALTVCSGGHQAAPGLNVADCGVCVFCLDKPKFGGPGTKKKPCKLKQLQLAMLVDRGRGDEPKAKRPKTSVSSARSAVVNIKVYHSPNLRNL